MQNFQYDSKLRKMINKFKKADQIGLGVAKRDARQMQTKKYEFISETR